jgi:hypothetical protein
MIADDLSPARRDHGEQEIDRRKTADPPPVSFAAHLFEEAACPYPRRRFQEGGVSLPRFFQSGGG